MKISVFWHPCGLLHNLIWGGVESIPVMNRGAPLFRDCKSHEENLPPDGEPLHYKAGATVWIVQVGHLLGIGHLYRVGGYRRAVGRMHAKVRLLGPPLIPFSMSTAPTENPLLHRGKSIISDITAVLDTEMGPLAKLNAGLQSQLPGLKITFIPIVTHSGTDSAEKRP